MKQIPTEQAVGHILVHDMTQIIPEGPDRYKGPRFRKGHVVAQEDVPVLLSMGKRSLYVWEMEPGMLHENEAAERLAALCAGPGISRDGDPSEGKIGLSAAQDGVLLVDSARLRAVNSVPEVMVATRRGNFAVAAGDAVAGTRVIPLAVDASVLEAAEAAAAGAPLLEVRPFSVKTAAVIATGSEVASGLIQDRFTPVVRSKLAAFGIEAVSVATPGDDIEDVCAAILDAKEAGADLVVCTGGMSVDPDDNTPGAIRRSGARVVTYGAPVLPGAMMCLAYFDDGTPVVGLPGCVMYADATIFDLMLPRLAARVPLTRQDFIELGEGGLCLRCTPCTYPHCPFGR